LSTAFPERIELEEVTVRIQTVEDAPALSRAILHSRDELRPWLPFANDDEAVTEDAQGQRLERVTGQWNSRTLFPYTMFTRGGFFADFIEVRPRPKPGRVSIGYWLDKSYWGMGLATSAARALIEAALAIPEINAVEIRCDQANDRSIALARRLGFTLTEVREHSVDAPGQTGRSMLWLKERPAPQI